MQAIYGSDERRAVEFDTAGNRLAGCTGISPATSSPKMAGATTRRPTSARCSARSGWQRAKHDVSLTAAYANNSLTGNGLQEQQFLERDYASVYTKPDTTDNRSTFVNLTTRHTVTERVMFSGNAYYRDITTHTLNGDINEDALDQAIYQPGAAERAALAAAGYTGVPASGADATNTPFPFWRCIGNVLLNDEPAEKCNGLINRTRTGQHNAGGVGQLTRARCDRRATAISSRWAAPTTGAASTSGSRPSSAISIPIAASPASMPSATAASPAATWTASPTILASISMERSTPGASMRPTRSRSATRGTHALGTLQPDVDPQSRPHPAWRRSRLTRRRSRVRRFNPAAGVTYSPSRALNVYVGYSEGSRAATSIELGCADPEEPCKLPNAMAGDPPLDQVVTRTLEAGARGHHRGLSWNAGVFRAGNHDDILFVTSEQTGFGYFRNFGETRRQGIELGASHRMERVTLGAGYTYLNATFESEETVNGESNSTNDAAEDGERGLEGTIEIEPGDRMPFIPSHMLKVYGDIAITSRLSLNLNLVAASSSYARGNENNLHEPDGGGLPRARQVARLRHRQSWGQVPGQAVDAGARPDQQSVRSSLLHGGTTRADGFHRDRRFHREASARGEWRVPRPTLDVLCARRPDQDVDRRAGHVLI